MKSNSLRGAGKALLAGALTLCAGLGLAAERNLLANPGFERCDAAAVEAQKVAGWDINTWSNPGVVALDVKEEEARSGSRCLRFTPRRPGAEAHLFQMVPVEGGKRYVFTAWVRGGSSPTAKGCGRTKIVVYQYGKDNRFLGTVGSGYLGVSGTWDEVSYAYTPSTEAGKVGCGVVALDGPLFFDDLSFSVQEGAAK